MSFDVISKGLETGTETSAGLAQMSEESTATLEVGTLIAYDLVYTLDTMAFAVGDSPELMWTITNVAGGNVTGLAAGVLTISRPDGGVDTGDPLIVSSLGPAVAIGIGYVYTFLLSGVYTLKLQLTTTDTPAQTRSSVVQVTVQ